MKKILKLLQPYIPAIILLIALTYGQVMASLQLPNYMAKIVNEGIVQENQDLIYQTGAEMVLVTVLGAICTIIIGYIAARIGTGFSRKLRSTVFEKIERFSLTEFNKFSTSSLITRSTNDIQQVQMVIIIVLRIVLSAPIMGIGGVIRAYNMAPSMTWIMSVAVGILLIVIIILFSLAVPRFTLLQKLTDKLNQITRENLNGLRVIRAFNRQNYEEKKFDITNKDLSSTNVFVNRLMAFTQPVMTLVSSMTLISIIWFGSHLIDTGNLMIGDMMAFMQYSMQVIMSFLMISIVFIMVPRALVSVKRVAEVLNTEPTIVDPSESRSFKTDTKGLVEFREVTFKYPDAETPVIKDISFIAKPGATTAIIGGTGSGKSTVINLIPRLFDVTSGQILIDGVDIRDIPQEVLHNKIGYISQKATLFSGTVASNIKYGKPDADESDMKKASAMAQAAEFVEKIVGQYDASVAQGGVNLSGGQKQRLSIARALLLKPDIYIFDDSFSALDFKTDLKLRKTLKEQTGNATVIIVAQRIGTILDADQIIVLDEGKIVGIGKHEDLMKSCAVYKEIALSQLSEKELQNARN